MISQGTSELFTDYNVECSRKKIIDICIFSGIDLGRLNISEVDKLESDENPNISVQVSVPSNPEPATSTSSSEDSRNTHISRNPLLSKTAYETGV